MSTELSAGAAAHDSTRDESMYSEPLSAAEATAYVALRSHAVWWDSTLVWSSFRGDKAVEALNGLITNDVTTLANGACMYAAALTPKGKMVSDMLVFRVDDTTLMVAVEANVAGAWLSLTRKYINPRLCKVVDESLTLRTWAVYGANAELAVTAACGALPRVIAAPAMHGVPGFLVVADATEAGQMAHITACLASGMASQGTDRLWTVFRVEAGRPLMGVDMDENTIPQEANLDVLNGISFIKGCYTGQETVARIYFRGHVNRHLRGLQCSVPLRGGAELTDEAGKVVGTVKSVAISPVHGSIALAMVRREVGPGAHVTVALADGSHQARVLELPFPPS